MSTLKTLNNGEQYLTIRNDINDNFTNLNNDKAEKSALSTIATTGSYGDLINLPDINAVADARITAKTNIAGGIASLSEADDNKHALQKTITQSAPVSLTGTSDTNLIPINFKDGSLAEVYFKNLNASSIVNPQLRGCGKNLFNGVFIPNMLLPSTNGTIVYNASANVICAVFPCIPNMTYAISANGNNRFYVGTTFEYPAVGVNATILAAAVNDSKAPIFGIFTASSTAHYFVIYASNLGSVGITLQGEQSLIVTTYEAYKESKLNITATFAQNDICTVVNGIAYKNGVAVPSTGSLIAYKGGSTYFENTAIIPSVNYSYLLDATIIQPWQLPNNLLSDTTYESAWLTSAISVAGSVFTMIAHPFASGDPIEFRPNTGILPTGVITYNNDNIGGTYYNIGKLTNDTFEIYSDVARTVKVTPTDAGTAGYQVRLAGIYSFSIDNLDLAKDQSYRISFANFGQAKKVASSLGAGMKPNGVPTYDVIGSSSYYSNTNFVIETLTAKKYSMSAILIDLMFMSADTATIICTQRGSSSDDRSLPITNLIASTGALIKNITANITSISIQSTASASYLIRNGVQVKVWRLN